MTSTQPLTIRASAAADAAGLRDLALLDSARPTPGPHLVAEVEDRLVAAVSLVTGATIADPFLPTADVTELLRTHARVSRPRRARRLTRRPALAV